MKKTFTTITLALVMALGSTFTFASGGIIVSDGIIVGDKNAPKCENKKEGIIVSDFVGIIVGDIVGIIVGDKAAPCSEKDGIIVGDLAGTGIIVGD